MATKINIGDVWKDVTSIKINIGDVWKTVSNGWVNIGDVWKPFYTSVVTHSIGEIFGGGIVFYTSNGGVNGIICAQGDTVSATWGCNTISVSTSSAVGQGLTNTNNINTACATANIAAKRCLAYSVSGFTDWYMPSYDELQLIYSNTTALTANRVYWCSTEATTSTAYKMNAIGVWATLDKSTPLYSRPIRYF